MNVLRTTTPAPAPADAPEPPALPAAVEARIEHLFRGARRAGIIHPLQGLVRLHRAQAEAAAASHAAAAREAP